MQPFVMSGFENTSNLKVLAEFPSSPVAVKAHKGYKTTYKHRNMILFLSTDHIRKSCM